jgi:hypothetical protein
MKTDKKTPPITKGGETGEREAAKERYHQNTGR